MDKSPTPPPVTPPVTNDERPLEARREALNDLGVALRPLHKLLIDLARADYEAVHGPVGGPVALHRLLINDPYFAWLYPLLQRMARIDEMTDDDELLAATDLAHVRRQTETLLLGEGETRGEFATRYVALLQNKPEVAIAHLPVRRALDKL